MRLVGSSGAGLSDASRARATQQTAGDAHDGLARQASAILAGRVGRLRRIARLGRALEERRRAPRLWAGAGRLCGGGERLGVRAGERLLDVLVLLSDESTERSDAGPAQGARLGRQTRGGAASDAEAERPSEAVSTERTSATGEAIISSTGSTMVHCIAISWADEPREAASLRRPGSAGERRGRPPRRAPGCAD